MSGRKWIAIPVSCAGNMLNYRIEASNTAGFSKFPDTTDAFLEYAKVMKRNNTPGGFALGHASNDGNAWAYWCLWAHGANLVDKNDKVIINSAETDVNMIPGTASWNDASNNKAFLGGEISWTDNAISIYVSAKNDPSKTDIARDMDHAVWPVGPVGKPTELHSMYPILAMSYTKYPQACKALMAFMLEADQFNPWLEAAQGFVGHCLNAYDQNSVWTADPKTTVFGEAGKRSLTAGGLGSVGEKAAAAMADFVLLDMFAGYCIGRDDARGAMRTAERRLQRIYR
jgi:multiple sugar transport system substrate-binding protein